MLSHTWSSHTTKRRAITMIDNPSPALRKKKHTHTHTSKTRGDGWNMRTHVEKEGDEAHLQLPVLTTPGFILCRNSSLYAEVAMAPTTPTSLSVVLSTANHWNQLEKKILQLSSSFSGFCWRFAAKLLENLSAILRQI